MKPEPGASLESARRSLAAASRALAGYRLMSGAEPEPADPGAPRDFAAAEARTALDEARARLALLQGELAGVRRDAAAREAELASARGEAEALGKSLAEARSDAEAASRRAAEAAGRASLLEAECVRLEKLRHAADASASDAEAQGREVADALRRELRAAHASLDRAAVEAGAADARAQKAQATAASLRHELAAVRAALDAARRALAARTPPPAPPSI